ncbi:terminase small subunit [Citromicrobium phage vB_CbaS-RXM]|nr:terminase small subunit [Citromicrobium phage vB_CbaS-RXM]
MNGTPGSTRGRKEGSPSNADHGPDLPDAGGVQLQNRKHELFARFLSEGEVQVRAYELAGYNPSTANASTLANKPHIATRVAFLKKEKEERDLRFQIELRKANLDPSDPVGASRDVAEWTVKQVLDLYWENARLAQMAGQFSTAKESLDAIAKIMGILGQPATGKTNDKPAGTQIGIALYQNAVEQLGSGGGVSPVGSDNPLAPAV